jgi:nitrite reductase/ring-hydroxylating ferredoxin subunit
MHRAYSNKCPHHGAPDHRLHIVEAQMQRASNISLSQKALTHSSENNDDHII